MSAPKKRSWHLKEQSPLQRKPTSRILAHTERTETPRPRGGRGRSRAPLSGRGFALQASGNLSFMTRASLITVTRRRAVHLSLGRSLLAPRG